MGDDALPVSPGGGSELGGGHRLGQEDGDGGVAAAVEVAAGLDNEPLQGFAAFGSCAGDGAGQATFCTRFCTSRIGVQGDLEPPPALSSLGDRARTRSRHGPKHITCADVLHRIAPGGNSSEAVNCPKTDPDLGV